MECGGISKDAFSCCYLTPPPLLVFHTALTPALIPPCHRVAVGCEDRGGMVGGKQSIRRQYFLVKCFTVTKQSRCWQRAPQISAALWLEHACGKDTPDSANRDSCKHTVLHGRSKKNCTTKKFLVLSISLKEKKNLPVQTR